MELSFGIDKEGIPYYSLSKDKKALIGKSNLWFEFVGKDALKKGMEIQSVKIDSSDSTWKSVWGEDEFIRDNHTSMIISLKESNNNGRVWNIHFKLFDDGLGFRYEFPKQKDGDNNIVISKEHTEFNLMEDALAWWIPADYDSYEYIYSNTKLSEIDATKAGYSERSDRHVHNQKAVNTPLTLKLSDGTYLSFHEANLTDYSDMTLAVNKNNSLVSELVPWDNGDKVRTTYPFVSPWRVIMVGDKAADLISNKIVLNLNEPCKVDDTSWIEPMKYTGIWWEMHLGKTAWSREKRGEDGKIMKHGANTKNALNYIDFNAKNNIKGLLVEGWNVGWESWDAGDGSKSFDFAKAYSDFDIEKIVAYGKKKGVELIGHHETGGDILNYENQLEKAMAFYNKLGVHSIKTGYAGGIKPEGQFHHGQFMVRHYRKVLETALKYKIMVNAHEPIKATGLRRTYPNMMSREGVRGMEYNAWGGGNPSSHTLILPFTRMLAGPIDYTPGIFDIKFEKYKKDQYVRTTLARQLANMVIIYSPVIMAADMIDNYNHPAFSFVKELNANFGQSLVIDGEIGEYIYLARKERGGDRWFIGCASDKARKDKIRLDFLDANKEYVAVIYKDGEDAHWDSNPTSYEITQLNVDNKSLLDISIAEGGGCAIEIKLK